MRQILYFIAFFTGSNNAFGEHSTIKLDDMEELSLQKKHCK